MREQHYYIPPDVAVCTDGTINQIDWPDVLRLHNAYDAWVMSFTGFGMPPIKYIEQRGPQQHGTTLLDFRLQKRLIQYIHRKKGCDRTDYWANRGNLIDFLRPNRQLLNMMSPGRLRLVQPDGTTRDIKAIIKEGPAFAARNPEVWDEVAFTEALRFECHDPTWFDPTVLAVTWVVETIDGLLFYSPTFPEHLIFPDNMIFGTDVLTGSVTVTYTGTWPAYPTITIVGPITGPKITNTALDIYIQLNYAVAVGETVTITTDYGNKTITNQLGQNLIGTRTPGSEMNFYIAPHPTATDGINIFTVEGSNAEVDVTSVSMAYNTRFIGV